MRRLLLVLAGLTLLQAASGPVLAHPFGIPPLAEIGVAGDRVRTSLTLALDDTIILFGHTRAPLQDPNRTGADALATQPEIAGYITDRYRLAVPEGPCDAVVTGGMHVSGGFRMFVDHTCPGAVADSLTVTSTLLRDVSPAYRLVAVVRFSGHRWRAPIEPPDTEAVVDLTRPPPVPIPDDAPAREADTRARGLERLFAFLDTGGTFGAALVSLGIAAMLGALHGLTPGHGKTLVAAYLAGSDARVRHAFAVGATMTITHTAAVLTLGIVALVAGQAVLPERVEPVLQVSAGGLVVVLGLWILRKRVRALRRPVAAHDHQHAARRAASGRGIVAVGMAGGIVPCPEAFGLLFVAMGVNRLAAGMLLLVAFSVGLAAVLVAVALALVLGRRALSGRLEGSRIGRALPVVSAVLVTGIGVALVVVGAGKA